jgi:hypothetical protein
VKASTGKGETVKGATKQKADRKRGDRNRRDNSKGETAIRAINYFSIGLYNFQQTSGNE